jgi:hypothetical protein
MRVFFLLWLLLSAHVGNCRALDQIQGLVDKSWWLGRTTSAEADAQQKDFDLAAQKWQSLAEQDSGDLRLWFNLGYAAYQAGNFKESIKAFSSAATDEKLRPEALFGLASSYWQSSDKKKAIETLEGLLSEGLSEPLLKKAQENLAYMKSAEPPRKKDQQKNSKNKKDDNKKNKQDKDEKKEGDEKDPSDEGDSQQDQSQDKNNSQGQEEQNDKKGEGKEQEDSEKRDPDDEAEQEAEQNSDKENEKETDKESGDKKQGDEKSKSEGQEDAQGESQTQSQERFDAQKFEKGQVRKRLRSLPDYVGKRRYHIKPENGEEDSEGKGGGNAPRW